VNVGVDNKSIAIDPQNPGIIYALGSKFTSYSEAFSSGFAGIADIIFKSTDGGANWKPMNAGLDPDTHVLTTVMATLNRKNGLLLDPYDIDPLNIQTRVVALRLSAVLTLAIDPLNPGTVYVGTSGGVYKSTDGGAHWQVMNTGLVEVGILALDPQNPTTIYGVTRGTDESKGYKSSVYKSTDGGAHWEPVNAGLDSDTHVLTLAIDSLNPTTVYAGTTNGVFKITFVSSSPP
jgi:photosystem II stability/assembly factor-like uncharacterized protein